MLEGAEWWRHGRRACRHHVSGRPAFGPTRPLLAQRVLPEPPAYLCGSFCEATVSHDGKNSSSQSRWRNKQRSVATHPGKTRAVAAAAAALPVMRSRARAGRSSDAGTARHPPAARAAAAVDARRGLLAAAEAADHPRRPGRRSAAVAHGRRQLVAHIARKQAAAARKAQPAVRVRIVPARPERRQRRTRREAPTCPGRQAAGDSSGAGAWAGAARALLRLCRRQCRSSGRESDAREAQHELRVAARAVARRGVRGRDAAQHARGAAVAATNHDVEAKRLRSGAAIRGKPRQHGRRGMRQARPHSDAPGCCAGGARARWLRLHSPAGFKHGVAAAAAARQQRRGSFQAVDARQLQARERHCHSACCARALNRARRWPESLLVVR